MCFGSAFIAANSSQQFKVRKVFLTQNPQHSYRVELEPLNLADDETISEEDHAKYYKGFDLYKRQDAYLGQKKSLSLTYDKDLRITIYKTSDLDENLKEKLQTISVKGIEQAVKEQINMERNVTKPKVSLSFELSRSHLFKFLKAEGKVEETYDFNVSVKVNDTKNETSSEETASDDSSSDNSTNSTKKP